jgi:glutamate synthase (NADPH/NADH) small chain
MVMMKYVALTAKKHDLPIIVSLNPIMMDGTGMCGACRVSVGGKTKFACVEGPEFDGHQVDFDEAIRRLGLYKRFEIGKNCEEHKCILADTDNTEVLGGIDFNFSEVSNSISLEEAQAEAARCLNCKNAKCVENCPVAINIPAFIMSVKNGNIAEAVEIIAKDNILPAVCGRVCPQETQCEGACILARKGKAVAIGKLERFVADNSQLLVSNSPSNSSLNSQTISTQPCSQTPTNSVAIIGSGPAGIACAAALAKAGFRVTIFEALHKVGGVLSYGIPEFRLPKAIVQHEINKLIDLGVEIQTNVVIGETLTIDDLFNKHHFDAVFIGSGAGLPKFMNIPGENLNGVFSANEILTRSNLMYAFKDDSATPIYVGSKCVVVGGGNVAMDAARTALRLGAETHLVYRRTRQEMPARLEEVEHAVQEGVIFHELNNPVEIIGNESGWVSGIKCVKMQLGEPDESGRRSPVIIPNSEFVINADTVIMALGTSPNPLISKTTKGLDTNKWQCIVADDDGQTSRKNVFAGGDAVTGAATVILAMGAGRKAAKKILQSFKND